MAPFFGVLRMSFHTLWICMGLLFTLSPARAYTITSTEDGKLIRWRYGQKLFLAGNPNGQDSIPSDFFYQTVVNGLQQWKWATEGQFDFDYWQGTNPSVYESKLKQDGMSTIFYASHSSESTDPNIIGFTQVWYNNTSGDLVEADIMLNDKDYELTTNPIDTSSKSASWGYRPKVYLGNIITHEIGHAIGLSHSSTVNASMLYVEFSEQSKIGCDDWSAARHLYPVPGGQTGALTGTILSPSSQPISGAVVTAISKSRGSVLATALTDQSGVYYFGALEQGDVGLMVQPFQGSPQSIPARVQSARSQSVCDSGSYPTNFITDNDEHRLQDFYVPTGEVVQAGSYRLKCDALATSDSLYQGTDAPSMFVDRGTPSDSKVYQFTANGNFSISGLGYLLMSPIKVDISIVDANGNPINVQTQSPMYESASTFQIPDTRITGSAVGPIFVKVTPSWIASSDYPTPSVWPSATPYYVITFNSGTTPLTAGLTENARCAPPSKFSKYQSPPGDPVRFSSTTSTRDGIGFCGGSSAQADLLHHEKRAPRSAPIGEIIGWLLPYLVALGSRSYFYSRRRV